MMARQGELEEETGFKFCDFESHNKGVIVQSCAVNEMFFKSWKGVHSSNGDIFFKLLFF